MPHVGLVPITEYAPTLYETWVGWGGEGIVLKEPASVYRPGIRSPAWLKVKPKVTLDIVVTGGSSRLNPVGRSEAGGHPRLRLLIQIRHAIRIRRDESFTFSFPQENGPSWFAGV